MPERPTFDLLKAVQAGDRSAFGALVRSQAARLYTIAFRVTRDGSLAEDVVQETFLRILKEKRPLRNAVAAEAWLARIAIRSAIDCIRSRESRRRREEDYAMELRETRDRPEEIAMDGELSDAIAEALGLVPSDIRAALWLHLVEGQSLRDVGACLGIARSTLSDRIRNGIEEVRRFLRRKGLLTLVALPPAELLRLLPAPTPPGDLVARLEAMGRAGEFADDLAGAAPAAGTASAAAGVIGAIMSAKKVAASLTIALALISAGAVAWKLGSNRRSGVTENPAMIVRPADASPPSVAGEAKSMPPTVAPQAEPPAAAQKPALAVRVVDQEGNRVAAARVRIRWAERIRSGREDPRSPAGLPPAQLKIKSSEAVQLEASPSGHFVCPERDGDVALLTMAAPGFLLKDDQVEVPTGGLSESAEVVLERGKAFAGRLVDVGNGDAPVEGARVGIADPEESRKRLEYRQAVADDEPPPSLFHFVLSDSEGRFRLTGVEGRLWILKEGFGPTLFRLASGEQVDEDVSRIPLYRPTRVHLSVRRAEGPPVREFEYRFGVGSFGFGDFAWHGKKVEGSEAVHLLTHRYSAVLTWGGQAPPLESVPFFVRVAASPTASREKQQVVSRALKPAYGEEIQLEVVVESEGRAVISGQVYGSDSRAIKEAEVFAATAKVQVRISADGRVTARGKAVKSDPRGGFRLAVEPGPVRVVVHHSGFAAYVSEPIVAPKNGEVHHDARLCLPARIAGRIADEVTDRAGRSVSISSSSLSLPRNAGPAEVILQQQTKADSRGTFVFENLPPGVYELKLIEGPRGEAIVSAQPGGTYDVVLGEKQLREGTMLAGRVLADGKPVADFRLNLHVQPSSMPFASFKSDADGLFRLAGVPPGSHLLSFLQVNRVMGSMTVLMESGMAPVEIDASSLTLEGRVSSEDDPVPDAKIDVYSSWSDGSWAALFPYRSGGEGSFRIEGLYRARYFLRFEKEGFVTRVSELDLTGQRSCPRQDVLLEKTGGRGRIRWEILDGDTGVPVREAAVTLYYLHGDAAFQVGYGTMKENEERIEIAGLPAGTYRGRITASASGLSFHATEFVDFEHAAGADQDLQARLRPGGGLSLAVASPDGRVPAGSSVEIFSPEGIPVPLDLGMGRESTRRFRGAVFLYGISAGECRVRVSSEGGKTVEKNCRIESGRTASLLIEDP